MKVIKLWATQTYIKSIEVDGKLQTVTFPCDARRFWSHETEELKAYTLWLDGMKWKYIVEELTWKTEMVKN